MLDDGMSEEELLTAARSAIRDAYDIFVVSGDAQDVYRRTEEEFGVVSKRCTSLCAEVERRLGIDGDELSRRIKALKKDGRQAPVSRRKWSRVVPAAPGWYWWRREQCSAPPQVVELAFNAPDEPLVFYSGSEQAEHPGSSPHGLWLAPIIPPVVPGDKNEGD